MNSDITDILANWPFDARDNVRKIIDGQGRSLIQVRVADGPFQGILQMALDGRPDGSRPHEHDYALDYWLGEQRRHQRDQGSDGEPRFQLSPAACKELFEESRRIYERYVFLLRLNEFELVARDTERNMRLFRFVNLHAATEQDREYLERWWPFVLRINAVARAMVALRQKQHHLALKIVATARQRLTRLPEHPAEEFRVERQRSYEALDELAAKIDKERPRSMTERLGADLQRALTQERYEDAARLRDQLATLKRLRQRVERVLTPPAVAAEPAGGARDAEPDAAADSPST